MRITVLAGGVGGARFVRGLREEVARRGGDSDEITVVVNTGDDLWLAGVRLMPDFDSILYALAGVNDTERGWGRAGETERVAAELREWGVGWPWFTLGDLDLGTHLARTSWLREGLTPSQVGERLQRRWPLGVRLIPATDTEVDTHVLVDVSGLHDDPPSGAPTRAELHFQEWWTRYRASLPALAFRQRNIDDARPAPGVAEAIADADLVLVAPSNPVVSIGTILAIPGIRDALATTAAPVVGVSPIIGGRVVRGMADACLHAIGVETDAGAVARHYGARSAGGLLDGWLVDETDAPSADALTAEGIASRAVPLWMRDLDTSATLAGAAIDLADGLRRTP
ncbi:2-phospho-L-lactate transferase [Agromyces intestinalis]|uniref:2-phospho-L-lactate transferase n=1 Tax=Agromyces intestinalis TaxID=2592652 RepID=A0A5C1YF67_9MICO|nr:2-phospho-L-lactate transferase [Agromyces intestinalis]QEO14704.1 2-phospho-L-lactate transferase [Agromyces intestinalis]